MSKSSADPQEIHRECGPLLLLAGPGTGKTYKLAQRIKYLVEDEGINPDCITVMTFTNAAALNMRQRISDPSAPELFIPAHQQPRVISTMHSLGHRIICEKAESVSLPTNPIVVRSFYLLKMLLSDAAQLAGYPRDDAKGTAECRQHGDCEEEESPKCEICHSYREILSKCGAIDHDDQILLASRLLAQDPEMLSKYQGHSSHVLIDEYQDINAGQYKLIRLLCAGHPQGLFAVGDDDQSIYSWRGGSPGYIRSFVDDFGPGAKVVSLTHAYRCRKSILEAALCVVREDDERIEKGEITYESSEEGEVTVHNAPSDKREAQIIRSVLDDMEPSETALILIPNRLYLPLITKQLRIGRLEYTCPVPQPGEGLPILERLSTWITDEKDSLALRECMEAILNNPSFGVPSRRSKATEKINERLNSYSAVSDLWRYVQKGKPLWDSLEQSVNTNELLRKIYESLKTLRNFDKKDTQGFISLAVDVLHPWSSTGVLLEEIQAWVGTFEEVGGSPSPRVRVMTYQGAKGLEADIVCVVGLEQGVLPRRDLDEEELAEQRRLLFVSMTRAKKQLHLFHVRKRSGAVSFQGFKGPATTQRSCFIDAIDRPLIDERYHPRAKK